MNSKHNKSDAFQDAIQLLGETAKEIYIRTETFFANLRCCLQILITTDVKQWNTISAGTCRPVQEHIVEDASRSKKNL